MNELAPTIIRSTINTSLESMFSDDIYIDCNKAFISVSLIKILLK